jgi:hypothetical protein
MKPILLSICLLLFGGTAFSQQADFIVLKKKNNRTLKTYYAGSFISAVTYGGFQINGWIKDIRNDSIIIRQEELRQFQQEFGMVLDTLVYTIVIDYREIKQWNYTRGYTWGGRKGFVQVAVPKILMIGGTGFIVLELVNTAYRKESLNEGNKLSSLAIAGGVALAGLGMEALQNRNKKVGKKYQVVYVKRQTS